MDVGTGKDSDGDSPPQKTSSSATCRESGASHSGAVNAGRLAAQHRVVLGAKRKAVRVAVGGGDAPTEEDMLTITPLGAGNEVGRSCILLQFKGKTIMLDCGVHPAYPGIGGLPFFDEMPVDPSDIDLLLVSHFHLDHAAALPYFTQTTSFKGRVFMTYPTKAILKMLLSDYVKVSNISVDQLLYTKEHVDATMEMSEQIDYHQERVACGVRFWCYNAGHVLGAAMFMIEIAGVKILYTGDFSREEDRHLMAAEIPKSKPDVLIVESTYGVQVHEPRAQREARFTSLVQRIVTSKDPKGGRCLIPVFALGRAQELLLILDEFWRSNPRLHGIPIYYASSLAKKCMSVYRTYINMMNENIRQALTLGNPFDFAHISNLKSLDEFSDVGPCVVMASPGLLQSGISRELFERWCSNRNNGVVIPGYCVEGTLAKTIMNEPPSITALNGRELPLSMQVNYISFSAHSDYAGTSSFIDMLLPPYIILVHGDGNVMTRLKLALLDRYKDHNINVFTPKNTNSVRLLFRAKKAAKVVGELAVDSLRDGKLISGVFVQKGDYSQSMVVAPSDLSTYTQLTTSVVTQEQTAHFEGNFSLLHHAVASMYERVQLRKRDDGDATLVVHDQVSMAYCKDKSQVVLSWESTPVNDMMADSLVSLILQTQSNPAAIRVECGHLHSHDDDEMEEGDDEVSPVKAEPAEDASTAHSAESGEMSVPIKQEERATKATSTGGATAVSPHEERLCTLTKLLAAQFGDAKRVEGDRIVIRVDELVATVHALTEEVECEDDQLRSSVQNALVMAKIALFPLSVEEALDQCSDTAAM
eukprot:CAMPEP_0174248236 /NCGR_PEP_ID=MMETSP0417-20130205/42976_1 /TAXON_ID=242541 /ORGANISM="Mayorella sp, Strain BSH-02190019" /LENGTH=814 /DNA_ID=CAMNT_0015328099 /DNA_START=129 /DNA_END=2573 /DNA_ORIENTATION=+